MNHLRWQCRRGMLELDVILNRFFESHYSSLSPAKQQLFEQLLKQDDPVLFDWLVVGVPCADPALQKMVDEINKCEPQW